jgi:hypothetical protein
MSIRAGCANHALTIEDSPTRKSAPALDAVFRWRPSGLKTSGCRRERSWPFADRAAGHWMTLPSQTELACPRVGVCLR